MGGTVGARAAPLLEWLASGFSSGFFNPKRALDRAGYAASAASSVEDPAFEAIKRYRITERAYEDASERNDEARSRARKEGREVSDPPGLEPPSA